MTSMICKLHINDFFTVRSQFNVNPTNLFTLSNQYVSYNIINKAYEKVNEFHELISLIRNAYACGGQKKSHLNTIIQTAMYRFLNIDI